MVPFFSFVATLLTTDFVGCGSLEGKTPNYDSDVFTCRTPTSELDERPPFPGGFPGTPLRFHLNFPEPSPFAISFSTSFSAQTKSKASTRYTLFASTLSVTK